ncbi:hypothetical protein [Methanococcoides sp. NM1]|uniref:hypothetical protein n=1 Tax=Methanococcoides sp. NM1 TaxID=1201013 RepID=UPI00108324F5|nr:hypothetical protein [Methanococcoides sp. NM1]
MEINSDSTNELSSWAREFLKERKESIDYISKFGSPLDKALIKVVFKCAEGMEDFQSSAATDIETQKRN